MFSVYFAAVTSTTEQESLEHSKERKQHLHPKYRNSVEHALSQADFMNSTEE